MRGRCHREGPQGGGGEASRRGPLWGRRLSCLVPQTAVFGTILATAYLGGAAATHVSAQEAFVAPVVVAVLLWTGIGLRDARLRAPLPLRRS